MGRLLNIRECSRGVDKLSHGEGVVFHTFKRGGWLVGESWCVV